MERIETLGSYWVIADHQYLRFPKDEGGRERPEWGGAEAGALQDAVWHEFTGRWTYDDVSGLLLETQPGKVISAPPVGGFGGSVEWWQRIGGDDLFSNPPRPLPPLDG